MKNLLICVLAMLGCAVFADAWRMEAEDFIPEGKWTVGNHALAHSNGKVLVADVKGAVLKGKYEIQKAGKYYVWARTNTLGGNWRQGNLFVNGKDAGLFGDARLKEGQKPGLWYWQALGVHELPAGEVEFKVLSVRGYVRVDAFIISDDAKFVPPNDVKEIHKIKLLDIAL